MKKLTIILIIFIWIVSCNDKTNYQIAFTVQEQDIIPEGITYSKFTNKFYISSILKTKIIEIDSETGKYRNFIPSSLYKRRFVGMMVDNEKDHLWACGNYKENNKVYSSVFKFDLVSNTLLKEYHFADTAQQLLNDLAIDNYGNAYITNSGGNEVFIVEDNSDSIKLFLKDSTLMNCNGITVSPDNRILYVSTYQNGIRVINIGNKKILNSINEFESRGQDGLKFYKNSLIGTQNYFDDEKDIKIMRYYLDESLTKIVDSEIIDQANPHFKIPTTHVIVNDELFCLATSSLDNVDWNSYKIINKDKLSDIKILKYHLK